MRWLIVVILALHCSSVPPSCDPTQTIRRALLKVTGAATIVAQNDLPPRVRQDLGAISQREVSAVAGLDLPRTIY
jgi:hypothetical protein